MQAKISKTLEAIIARTAFETSKRAITHSLKDFLTLEILREEGSLAHQILTSRLKDWEIHQICLRIESEIRSVSAPDSSRQNPEEFFPLYTRELQRLFAPMHHVSTAHALLHIVSDPHTITSQVLAMYHFDAQAIATELQKMTSVANQKTPSDTDFRPTPELRFIGLREPVRGLTLSPRANATSDSTSRFFLQKLSYLFCEISPILYPIGVNRMSALSCRKRIRYSAREVNIR